jgi:hypothetical protein
MAGAAVQFAPALPVFPANREFYRKFCEIAALAPPETANKGVVTAKQRILGREQGILSPGIEIIAEYDFRDKGPLGNVRFTLESGHCDHSDTTTVQLSYGRIGQLGYEGRIGCLTH